MPLLPKRRSVLDLFGSQDEGETTPAPPSSLTVEESPLPPRPVSEYGFPRSRLSHEVLAEDVPDPAETQSVGRAKRFSMLKFRNLSESQLAVQPKEVERKAKVNTPPVPALPSDPMPAIMKTAPTMEPHETPEEAAEDDDTARELKRSLFSRSMSKGRTPSKRTTRKSTDEKRVEKKTSSMRWRRLQGRSTGLEDLQRLANAHVAQNLAAPPSYGDETDSALALPISDHRFSEAAESEGSNGSSDQIYGSTTTTTHTVSTHTTFFKLPRRNKNRNSLFPLPVKIPPPNENNQQQQQEEPTTPRASTAGAARFSQDRSAVSNEEGTSVTTLQRAQKEDSVLKQQTLSSPNNATPVKQSLSLAQSGMNLFRQESQRSRASSGSSRLQPPTRLGMRDRASTNSSSLGRSSHEMSTPPPMNNGSARNSTSTQGRSSFGGLLNLPRFRQSSDPHSPRHGSPGTMSKSNSFAMSREALVVPEREEGDTPSKYLERLEAAVARSMIAGILSKSADPFAQAVLRSYTRRFAFFGEPIDMSLRKFLLEAELPKETQQVDRVIQAFADRYHECNPGIYVSPDQAYIIAFSLMMLHTDAFNKNNKRKMQKQDYIKNTSGQSVSDDVLGCFYDNICYTPFVHYEEEVDINGERVLPFKTKKSRLRTGGITDSGKKPSGPVDPYNLLVDQKLDHLRPPLRDSIMMEDPYDYHGSQAVLDPKYLQRAFTHTGVLQIISQRSRPSAYEGQFTNGEPPNPMEMQPGIIDLKITKVGTLWRKSAKKKKTRSPWQEWGAILTGSQLYLFKNAHWAKGLVHQFMAAQKHGHPRIPVVFKPPLQELKPDALVKTDNAVVLTDTTYTRHKHAFTFVNPGGMEEVFLADNDSELNDWLALINYAAAFRAAGVRIRGMVGGTEEDLRARDVRRLESTQSARSTQTTDTTVSVHNRGLSPQLQRQVMAARRQIMVQKIGEANKELAEANKLLDNFLRNARHLLVLAPIVSKTREDIIHAAAQSDASIKWTRRNIWRMKCHRDILAMDVQQDGLSAAEVEMLAEQQIEASPDSANRARKELALLNSKSTGARSPPLSPVSATRLERPLTASSIDDYISGDVFRTPSDPTVQQGQLDVLHQEQQHRGSVSSTLLTTSSQGRASLSHTSSTSSIHRVQRLTTEAQSQTTSHTLMTPSQSPDDPETEKSARKNLSAERVETLASRSMGMDGAPPTPSPESSKQRHGGVRRSLQKTLRDANPTNSQRHRRGKESDNSVRSGGNDEGEGSQESTPVLQREKGRFILHGKQASVVQFGSEWPDEKMKARRELFRQHSSSPRINNDLSRDVSFTKNGWRADTATPIVDDLTHDGDESTDDDGRIGSLGSIGSEGFKADAQAADAFTNRKESVSSVPSMRGETAFYDAMTSQGEMKGKRETVIGPQRSLQPENEEASIRAVEESAAEDADGGDEAKDKRKTVIGPVMNILSDTNGGAKDGDDGSTASGDVDHEVRPVSQRTAVQII